MSETHSTVLQEFWSVVETRFLVPEMFDGFGENYLHKQKKCSQQLKSFLSSEKLTQVFLPF